MVLESSSIVGDGDKPDPAPRVDRALRKDGPNPISPCAYTALGVSKSSTGAEIQRAYYLLAKETHPDVGDRTSAGSPDFKTASQAWAVLRNPSRRRLYDRGEIDVFGRVTDKGRRRRRIAVLVRSATIYFAVPVMAGSLGLAALIGMPEVIPATEPPVEVVSPVTKDRLMVPLRERATFIDEAYSEPPELEARPIPAIQDAVHLPEPGTLPVSAPDAGRVSIAVQSKTVPARTVIPAIPSPSVERRKAIASPRPAVRAPTQKAGSVDDVFGSLFAKPKVTGGSRSAKQQASSDHPFAWQSCNVTTACKAGVEMCGC